MCFVHFSISEATGQPCLCRLVSFGHDPAAGHGFLCFAGPLRSSLGWGDGKAGQKACGLSGVAPFEGSEEGPVALLAAQLMRCRHVLLVNVVKRVWEQGTYMENVSDPGCDGFQNCMKEALGNAFKDTLLGYGVNSGCMCVQRLLWCIQVDFMSAEWLVS